jgi:WD40 repeat protein
VIKRLVIYFLIFQACLLLQSSKNDTVKESAMPTYGKLDISSVQKITCKSEVNGDGIITKVLDLSADSRGNIFVLEIKSKGVLRFSSQGEFVGYIGRSGQGPGEFNAPWALYVSNSDFLYVFDFGDKKISCFNEQGGYLDKKAISQSVNIRGGFIVDNEGDVAFFTEDFFGKKCSDILQLFNFGGERTEEIARFADDDRVRIESRGSRMAANWYSKRIFVCSHGDSLIFGNSLDPNIYMWNKKTRKQKVVAVIPIKKEPMNSQEIEFLEGIFKRNPQDLVLPPYKPFYKRVLTDEKGRIYVVRLKSILDQDKTVWIDIFDRNGKYLYLAKNSSEPWQIGNGMFISVGRDVDENQIVIIDKIKGYDSWKY